MLGDDFIPLAIKTHSCFHPHFDSFLISCVHAYMVRHQQASLVHLMLIFHYGKQMSIALWYVQAIAILQRVAMLSHNILSFAQIPISAPPSLGNLWHRMPFQHYDFHFITTIFMVLVFLSCVYICINMPCIFCGWISILVYIYIYKFPFFVKLKNESHTIKICTKYFKANLYLGDMIRNITPQIFQTHPTSKQHRTLIKKTFHSKLFVGLFILWSYIFFFSCK